MSAARSGARDALWLSFGNAWKAYAELDALYETLQSLLAEPHQGLTFEVDDEDSDTLVDEGDWGVFYYLASYPIRGRRKPSARRSGLGAAWFAASLWRPEDDRGSTWSGARRAKFYAAYAPKGEAWTIDDLFVDGNGRAPGCEAAGPRVWARGAGEGLSERPWFFCVPLESLDGRAALETEVVRPFRLLLERGDPGAAFGPSSVAFLTGSSVAAR